jgi:hypothetical protein
VSDFKTADEGGRLLWEAQESAKVMAAYEANIESGYALLGWKMLEISEMQYWRVGYATWREYVKVVAEHAHRTPGQIMQYFLTVRDLSDTFSIKQMEEMGITKAVKLRGAKDYLLIFPDEIVEAALDPKVTVKELKRIIDKEIKAPEEEGDWYDAEMEFMVTPEQRELFDSTIEIAMRTDPQTKTTISKSAQMCDVFEKLCMEFRGAHSGDGN